MTDSFAAEARILWDSTSLLHEAERDGDEAAVGLCLEEIKAIAEFTDQPQVRRRCFAILEKASIQKLRASTVGAAGAAFGAFVGVALWIAEFVR